MKLQRMSGILTGEMRRAWFPVFSRDRGSIIRRLRTYQSRFRLNGLALETSRHLSRFVTVVALFN